MKDLKVYLRYPSWVVGDLLVAPLWFVFFVLSMFIFSPPLTNLEGTLNYVFWGYAFVMIFNTTMIGVGHFVVSEQQSGTLEQLFLAPVSRLTLIAGRWARAILIDLIIIISTAAFLLLTEGIAVTAVDAVPLVVVLLLLEVGLLGLALVVAAMTLRFRGTVTAVNYAWFGVVIFSGVFFPITSLPSILQVFSLLLPTTYYVDIIKHFAIGTPTLLSPSIELAGIAAMTFLLLVLGWVVFGWLERSAKVKGLIGLY